MDMMDGWMDGNSSKMQAGKRWIAEIVFSSLKRVLGEEDIL